MSLNTKFRVLKLNLFLVSSSISDVSWLWQGLRCLTCIEVDLLKGDRPGCLSCRPPSLSPSLTCCEPGSVSKETNCKYPRLGILMASCEVTFSAGPWNNTLVAPCFCGPGLLQDSWWGSHGAHPGWGLLRVISPVGCVFKVQKLGLHWDSLVLLNILLPSRASSGCSKHGLRIRWLKHQLSLVSLTAIKAGDL